MRLLLEADESEPVVRSYLDQGTLFTIDEDDQPRGVVLVIGEGGDLEIKNIAVEQNSRGRGIGTAAIALVIDQARSRGFRRVIVGTADVSVGTIRFYQRRGFRIYGVRRGFFDEYPEVIVEHGRVAHDMVMLEIMEEKGEELLNLQKRISKQGWAVLPLRLMIGFGFAAHGYAKLSRGPAGFGTILTAIGVPAPALMAWITSLLEFFGGVSIMIGAFIIPVSVPLVIVMLTAMFSVHLQNGFSTIKLKAVTSAGAEFGAPGYEMNLLYIAGLVTLALSGPGPASVDQWRREREKKMNF
jgi:putative oxidoreductase